MADKKTLFIASSTQLGGAEKQLLLLIQKLQVNHSVALCLLDPTGGMLVRYQELGITTYISRSGALHNLIAIHHAMNEFQPDVVVNWLYKADILGGLVAKLHGAKKIVNSARNTKWVKFARWKMLVLVAAEKLFATDVVSNAEIGKQFHLDYGYSDRKFSIIENFLDADLIAMPKKPGRLPTIGIASRATEGKGHQELIRAISSNDQLRTRVGLSFVGPGITEWPELTAALRDSGITHQLHGYTPNLSAWFSEVDIYAALSTKSESDSSSLLDAVLTLTPLISSAIQNLRALSPAPATLSPTSGSEVCESIIQILDGTRESRQTLEVRRENLIAERGADVIISKWQRLLEG